MLVRNVIAKCASTHPQSTVYIRCDDMLIYHCNMQKFVSPGKDINRIYALSEKKAIFFSYDSAEDRIIIDIPKGAM